MFTTVHFAISTAEIIFALFYSISNIQYELPTQGTTAQCLEPLNNIVHLK